MNEIKKEIERLIRNINYSIAWRKITYYWKKTRDIILNSLMLAIVGFIFLLPFMWWAFVVYVVVHFVSKYW